MASTGVNVDPVAAAQRALCAHLNLALPASLAASGYQIAPQLAQRIQDGWVTPEQEILEPDGSGAPKNAVVTVTCPTDGTYTGHAPQILYSEPLDPGDAEIVSIYRVGFIELPMQLDVWAKSRAEREALAGAVRVSLRAALPSALGLELTSYYGVRAQVRIAGTGFHSDQGSLVGGAWWRYTVELVAEFDEVVKTTAARLKELYLRKFIPHDAAEPDTTERIF